MPSLTEQIKELRRRVIRGDKALICCRAQENKVMGEVTQMVGTVYNMITAMTNSKQALVIAPVGLAVGEEIGVQIGVSRIWISQAAKIPVGAAIIMTGAQVLRWNAQLWATEMAAGIAAAIGTITKADRANCYECLRQRVLPQDNPRHYKRGTYRTRN